MNFNHEELMPMMLYNTGTRMGLRASYIPISVIDGCNRSANFSFHVL